jgi:hypothetical protein
MKAGLAARKKTQRSSAIQQRLDTLSERFINGEINTKELLDGFSSVCGQKCGSKEKKNEIFKFIRSSQYFKNFSYILFYAIKDFLFE